ncbi:titin-like, partial, partial [Paramuricea clavata]
MTGKVNEYKINNLTSYTTYEISVAAGNVHGFGEETIASFLTTSEALLPGKPTNLTVIDITSRSVEIFWLDPKEPGRFGISRFWIKLKKENSLILNVTIGKVNKYKIDNLNSYSIHAISVAAGNIIGFGEESTTLFSTTSE